MYNIQSDIRKNLLILHLEGNMTDAELRQGAADVVREAAKLKPGFVVINDISKMKPATQTGAEEILKAQKQVAAMGVGRIIRVTEDPISKMQFSRTARQAGYQAENASSMEEALAMVRFPQFA